LKKREWIIVIFPLVFVWIVDQVTKLWAMELTGAKVYGPLAFVLHFNPGAMLGLWSDLPPVLRVVSLSTGGALLLMSYIAIQYLLPTKSLILRSGMSMLIGGILGNVTDRIVSGKVTDFIIIGTGKVATGVFNVADALQWLGYGMIVYALIRDREKLWPENDTRQSHWILPRFQLKYCFVLVLIGLAFNSIVGTFSYMFIRVTIDEIIGTTSEVHHKYLTPFIITFMAISAGLSVLLFLLGRMISHRTAGPLYAFDKYLDDVLKQNYRTFKLRSRDEFPHLADVAENISRDLMKLHELEIAIAEEQKQDLKEV
jgi:signal peptidase II